MSERQIIEFGRAAEPQVRLPDLAELERRGRRLRRRRSAGLAGVLVSALAISGFWAADRSTSADGRVPVADPDQVSAAVPYSQGFGPEPLDAGTYSIVLNHGATARTALVTVPDGWHAWIGPSRYGPRGSYVGVLVLSVRSVVDSACQPTSRMRPVEGDAEAPLAALTSMPRHRVVQGPTPPSRRSARARR